MSLSLLTNTAAMSVLSRLDFIHQDIENTLLRLSTGSRINSGADDPAGMAIADGLHANVVALTQSAQNVTNGIGLFQLADGALGQVTVLLNRAVTLATQASTGTVNAGQRAALDAEYKGILQEISRIGSNTTYNGTAIFGNSAGSPTSIFVSDGSSAGGRFVSGVLGQVDAQSVGFSAQIDLSTTSLSDATNSQAALQAIRGAIDGVAADRGQIGATINQLHAETSLIHTQVENLTAAEDHIRAADIPAEIAHLMRMMVQQQLCIYALQQSMLMQRAVLQLLR